VVGTALEIGIKAYGSAAVLSVALSDAETAAGKRHDAIHAIPNLVDRYQDAKYVLDHRAEIGYALDYVHQHAPDPEQLDAAAQQGIETLNAIETTYDEVIEAGDAITTWNPLKGVPEAFSHLDNAWNARPDFDSIHEIAGMAHDASPVLQQAEVLTPRLYWSLLTLVDNFAADEIGATLAVMAGAFALAFVLGTAVGFWARRGRPGLLSRALQSLGARLFRGWYVANLEYAVGPRVYAAAVERTRTDLLADPEGALDPESFRELEEYFERRARQQEPALSRW
jgi:hypothetical protein